MYRPLLKEDFLAMHSRMTTKGDNHDCWVYVREDYTLTDGRIINGMGAWGHPDAYTLISHNGKAYAIRSWDKGNTRLLGD